MPGHECYHCKQWVEEGEAHDCWTTTETALTRDLSEDLRDAYERLRETAAEFGEQRIYASHHSIMFSRKTCYFFVRPKRKYLEVVIFLGRRVHAPQVKRAEQGSKAKYYHILHLTHRDEVETPITGWLREAYDLQDVLVAQSTTKAKKPPAPKKTRKAVTKKPATAKKVNKIAVKAAVKAAVKKAAKKAVKKAAARKRATRR
jgi:hypothetical protein